MPNNNLINEEQLPGNLVPIDTPTVVPGKAPSVAAAPPVPHDMPQFFSGSLAPQLQHDVSFFSTTMASPRVPKFDLMPLGTQSSAFTNSATQSTATIISSGSGATDTDFYQFVALGGSNQVQRGILNFSQTAIFNLADNGTLGSTDVSLKLDVANGVPSLTGSGYFRTTEFPAFTGDVAKPAGGVATTVIALQSTPMSSTPPQDGQWLQYSATAGQWQAADLPASASGTLYLDAAASPVGGGYLSLITTFPTTAETTSSASGNSGAGQVLVAAFASGFLGTTTIAQGMWTPDLFLAVDSLTQSPQAIVKIYTRTSGGTETLQATLTINLTATAVTQYLPTVELPNIATNPTDRVVLKVYLQAGGSSTRTLTLYYDGSTHVSHLHLPGASINAVRSEYVNAQTGTSYTFSNTGDRGNLVTFSNASAVTATLPQPNTTTFVNGWFTDVQNLGAGSVALTPTSATINGAASLVLLKGQGLRIVSDGTNYQIVDFFVKGTPTNGQVPTYVAANNDVEWAAPAPTIAPVVYINSVPVSTDKHFHINGADDGATVWLVSINGTADGG